MALKTLCCAFRTFLFILLSISLLPCFASADLIWSDEFDGTSINKNVWTWDVGGHGWGNGQMEYNTARRENSYIDNGSLVLEARREFYKEATTNQFTSARMLTQGRFAFKYGTLEARIKMPNTGNGLWPAFWLLGNNFDAVQWPECGEIDIVEMGSKEGIAQGLQTRKINAAIHYDTVDDGTFDPATYDFDAGWLDAPVDLSADYHLYKLEWTPTAITAYLDGVQYWTFDITAEYLREFHQPHYPILNIAIGSWPTGYTGIYDIGGITAPLPGRMYVDYIRLYSHPQTEIYMGADEESGNFGVFTETVPVNSRLTYVTEGQEGPDFYYSDKAALYIWNNLTETTPPAGTPEGSECWSFSAAAGTWYGMGVMTPTFRNMNNYSDGIMHLDMATTTNETIKIGIKTSVGGESWLPLEVAGEQFGLVRDGQWHEVRIPLNRFSNADFKTVHQILMIAGDPPAAPVQLSIDNVWWEPSVPRQMPQNGNFGVYTENAAHKDAGQYELGVDGDFFIWAHTLVDDTQTPYEGSESMSLKSAAGLDWFGCAFTPNVKYNLTAFRYPESKLVFSMKTSSTTEFRVGMKSGNVDGIGQKWISFTSGSDPYGFVRDGQWHVVEIPMSHFTTEVDLSEVSQLFEILGTSGPISGIQVDDIYLTGGGSAEIGGEVPPTVSITSPASGTFFDPNEVITITAEAADADGTVAKVEFYEGLNLLGEDATSPYTFTWSTGTEGAYTLRAKAFDNENLTRMSAAATVYVGTPRLSSIRVTPSTASVEEGRVKQFTGKGFDQFGLEYPLPAGLYWSVSGGGVIDEKGWFAGVKPSAEPYTVTATEASEGLLSDTAAVTVFAGGLCTGQPLNGDYTWEASGIGDAPAVTFIPSNPNIGNTLLIFYYSKNSTGAFPGYTAQAGVRYPIAGAAPGDIIYFYHTYNTPSGEHSTFGDKQIFQVGNCPAIVASDFDKSGVVDLADLAHLGLYWLAADCDALNYYCEGADHVGDGDVDMHDFNLLSYTWLKEGGSGSGTGIAPMVSITSPSNGAAVAPNTTVAIQADASDADGNVVKVEFFADGVYLGQDITSPYSYSWANIAEGEYVLTAKATDNEGLVTTSQPVTLHVETIIIPDNRIANGGFEDGMNAWTPNLIGAGSSAVGSAESPLGGSYAAKLVTNWAGGSGVKAEILQTVTGLSGGASLNFKLWVKGSMGTGGVAYAEIKWLNASGGQVGGTGLINLHAGLSSTVYQEKGGTYTTPAGTASAQVAIRLEGGAMAALNTLYVDEVSL
ncbi:MAG: Ig-like domain-containing protein [Planctomycetaceae bacterium]|nr:Ig-like domain-containing protein [Planctomycetaceae bacterium]